MSLCTDYGWTYHVCNIVEGICKIFASVHHSSNLPIVLLRVKTKYSGIKKLSICKNAIGPLFLMKRYIIIIGSHFCN